jgi:hypothetical protein
MPRTVERTVYKFDELSPRAQEKALDDARYWNVYHGWWECTYEDAVLCAECLGITIDTENRRPQIFFSINGSQGDGAAFTGRVQYKPDAIDTIKAHAPRDEELLAIAQALTTTQLTCRMTTSEYLWASISLSGRSTSIDMNCMLNPGDEVPYHLDVLIRRTVERFAQWIFTQLHNEHEYLTSDECIKEALAEHEFDEDGTMI